MIPKNYILFLSDMTIFSIKKNLQCFSSEEHNLTIADLRNLINEEFKTEKPFQTFITNISKTDQFEASNALKSMRSRIGNFLLCKQILHQQQIECK